MNMVGWTQGDSKPRLFAPALLKRYKKINVETSLGIIELYFIDWSVTQFI
jgi:hypothetical protein